MKTGRQQTGRLAGLRKHVRIIVAISAKDIVEALKNKNTIAVILTAVAMVFVYRGLPLLTSDEDLPRVLVYDAGESVLVPLLENSTVVELRSYDSAEKMQEVLRDRDTPMLGLVIPADFDHQLETGIDVSLEGYVLSWLSVDQVQELTQTFEAEISYLLGKPTTIQTAGNIVHLEPDSTGIGTSAAIALVFVVTMIGLTLIPHLMLEEKQAHTLEVMLVSPANAADLVLGKAVVGLFYALLGALIALAVYSFLVVHWWLALLVAVLGALFTVSLGILLGTIVDSRGQLSMWAWLLIIPLFLPVFLSLMEGLVPDNVIAIFRWIPTTVMLNLTMASFAVEIPLGSTLFKLGWICLWVLLALVLDAWLVRRKSQQAAGAQTTSQKAVQQIAPLTTTGLRILTPLFPGMAKTRQKPVVDGRTDSELDSTSNALPEDVPQSMRGLRITWAIALKDIRATLTNKLALSIILGSAMIMLSNAVLPLLLQARDTPVAIVYDQGRSTIIRSLAASDDVRIGVVDSLAEMQEIVSESAEVMIGIVIPAGFDDLAGSSEPIQLAGYAVHWGDSGDIAERISFFEAQLGLATWGSVGIDLAPDRIYPREAVTGQLLMTSMMYVFVIITLGIMLVPLLMVEERQNHTLEMLLVSPANISQVISGKMVAGAFYGVLAVAVVFLLTRYLVVHWEVALLAALLSVLFTISVGMLVGVLSDSPTTAGMWGTFFMVILMSTTIISSLGNIAWPPLVEAVLRYFPSTIMFKLFGMAFLGEIALADLLVNAAVLISTTALFFGFALWLARRRFR